MSQTNEYPARYVCTWIACYTLALSGCINTRIPADWPSFTQSDDKGECAALTGQYSNSPVDWAYREPSAFRTVGGQGAHDYWLSQLFGPLASVAPADHENIKYITIQTDGADRILIRGTLQETGKNAISLTLLRNSNDAAGPDETEFAKFSCENGFVHISRFGWAPITPMIAAGIFRNAYIRLRRAVDGSLIVNVRSDDYATLPLIPVPITPSIEGFDSWYMFEHYHQQSSKSVPTVQRTRIN